MSSIIKQITLHCRELHWRLRQFTPIMTSSNGNIYRVTGPLCGEFNGPGEFPAQRPVTRSFDVFFDLRLIKWLSKEPWGWWFETPSLSLWCHCNALWTRYLCCIWDHVRTSPRQKYHKPYRRICRLCCDLSHPVLSSTLALLLDTRYVSIVCQYKVLNPKLPSIANLTNAKSYWYTPDISTALDYIIDCVSLIQDEYKYWLECGMILTLERAFVSAIWTHVNCIIHCFIISPVTFISNSYSDVDADVINSKLNVPLVDAIIPPYLHNMFGVLIQMLTIQRYKYHYTLV